MTRMARMSISGFDSTLKMLEEIGSQTQAVAEEAVKAAGGMLADDIRSRLEGNLVGSKYSKGDLLDSFGVSPPRMNSDGTVDVKVGFHSYDRKGVANQLKARAMEKGTSRGQKKRPFVRPAVVANRKKIRALMERIVYANFDAIQKG